MPRGFMQAVYYRDEQSIEPVSDYIDSLPVAVQAHIDWKITLLNALRHDEPGPPFPHSTQVEGELRELRCRFGTDFYRILYRRSGNLFILLHILNKKTPKIPKFDKDIAWSRWADFTTRMNAEKRRPPRAAGHDAP